MKIVLVGIYFGEWPVWFPAFLQSCKYNPGMDWLLFTDCAAPEESPDNVQCIPFSMTRFNRLASDALGFEVQVSNPFKICDFRPAFGVIFEEYLDGYDFWGHCDLDVIWGDLRHFITDAILCDHDIISARRKTMCGHFSLYRNTRLLARLYTRHPEHRQILQSPNHFVFDEHGITRIIRPLTQKGVIDVYWPTILLNFADPPNKTPGRLGKYRNHWYWEGGKLYELEEHAEGERQEVMYLHFMTWKKSMRACYFRYAEDPQAFYISYSHIGLTTSDPSPPGASLLLYRTQAIGAAQSILRRTQKLWRQTLGLPKVPPSTRR